jgi:hypothetical protein
MKNLGGDVVYASLRKGYEVKEGSPDQTLRGRLE